MATRHFTNWFSKVGHGGIETIKLRKAECPRDRCEGALVERVTLQHLLCPELRDSLGEGPFHFCKSAHCSVVYFNAAGGEIYERRDVLLPVSHKAQGASVPLCPCFGVMDDAARREVLDSGASTAPQYVKARMEAEGCHCVTTNPAGRCCLGGIGRRIKIYQQERELSRGEFFSDG